MMHLWRRGRVVECTGLENRQGFVALREFESLRLLQIRKPQSLLMIAAFFVAFLFYIVIMMHLWRRGRVVECTGLENRQGFVALREFESLRLLQIRKKPQSILIGAFFMYCSNDFFQ